MLTFLTFDSIYDCFSFSGCYIFFELFDYLFNLSLTFSSCGIFLFFDIVFDFLFDVFMTLIFPID